MPSIQNASQQKTFSSWYVNIMFIQGMVAFSLYWPTGLLIEYQFKCWYGSLYCVMLGKKCYSG